MCYEDKKFFLFSLGSLKHPQAASLSITPTWTRLLGVKFYFISEPDFNRVGFEDADDPLDRVVAEVELGVEDLEHHHACQRTTDSIETAVLLWGVCTSVVWACMYSTCPSDTGSNAALC